MSGLRVYSSDDDREGGRIERAVAGSYLEARSRPGRADDDARLVVLLDRRHEVRPVADLWAASRCGFLVVELPSDRARNRGGAAFAREGEPGPARPDSAGRRGTRE